MAWYHEIASAAAALFRRRHQDAEMKEEIQFHLEMEARRNADAPCPRRTAQDAVMKYRALAFIAALSMPAHAQPQMVKLAPPAVEPISQLGTAWTWT